MLLTVLLVAGRMLAVGLLLVCLNFVLLLQSYSAYPHAIKESKHALFCSFMHICTADCIQIGCWLVQIERLPVYFKQRDNYFFPAWTFVIPTTLMRLPVSFIESLVYTVITYFEIDLAPTAGR